MPSAKLKFFEQTPLIDTALAAPKSDEGWSPCIDNRPLLAVGKPELRETKAVFVTI